jgi:methionyl-tRNA synthetase
VPDAADEIWKQLGLQEKASTARFSDLAWGGLKVGTRLGPLSPVFPRIEEKEQSDSTESGEEPAQLPQHATIEDFQKLGLKVAEIKAAEKIQGSKKLLKLTVDLGNEVRVVVAGIAEVYTPDELLGRQVVVVTNLKPTKLMGVESNGMILAASVNGKPVLVSVSATVPTGTIVK